MSEIFEAVYGERCRKTEENEDREVCIVLRKAEQHADHPRQIQYIVPVQRKVLSCGRLL
jgi:hypothetical protein